MQALARAARGLWPAAAEGTGAAAVVGRGRYGQVQPSRGIVVQVRDGNLERALQVMERKMRSSGIERLIKRRTEHHVKNSEKRVLAHKALMARVRSQELGKKLRDILIKKIRSAPAILLPPLSSSITPFMCWLLVIAVSLFDRTFLWVVVGNKGASRWCPPSARRNA
jgi:small subunit ribosomal protein S21